VPEQGEVHHQGEGAFVGGDIGIESFALCICGGLSEVLLRLVLVV